MNNHRSNPSAAPQRRSGSRLRGLVRLALAVGVPLMLASAGRYLVADQVDYQTSRNAFLKAEIGSLDPQIREIQQLERTMERVLVRANILEELDPLLDRLIDQLYLLSQAPHGVSLESVRIEPARLQIIGRACCLEPLVGFTERLGSAPDLEDLDLRRVTATSANKIFEFEMNADLAGPGARRGKDLP